MLSLPGFSSSRLQTSQAGYYGPPISGKLDSKLNALRLESVGGNICTDPLVHAAQQSLHRAGQDVHSIKCGWILQEGEAAAHHAGQLPEHQQHAHGHQVPAGAAAATAPTAAGGSGNANQQQGSGGQQPSGSGSSGSGTSGGGGGAAGNSGGGQGAGGSGRGGDGPGRGNGSGDGRGPAGGQAPGGSGEQQAQQGQQTSQAQPAGSWAAANYGYVWNMPQWVPATSMALFAPAMGYQHMQYAGQTNPASVVPELQVCPLPLQFKPSIACPCADCIAQLHLKHSASLLF